MTTNVHKPGTNFGHARASQRRKRAILAFLLIGVMGAGILLFAQQGALQNDADQINDLLVSLSDHSRAPSDTLDPALSGIDRDKSLQRFKAPHYELSLVPTEGIHAIAGDSASIPIRVHFDDKNGNSMDADATAQFVKRNGIWYFANFDFMGWPGILIGVLVFAAVVLMAYLSVVVVLAKRLAKQGELGANATKVVLPIFWPVLFRQTSAG